MARRAKTPKWLAAARAAGTDRKVSPETGRADWIGRALPRAGVCPPEEVEALLQSGRVRVNGRIVKELLANVPPGAEVAVDRHPVEVNVPPRVLAFHKPAGVVTDVKDRQGVGTVFELFRAALPEELKRYGWHAIGRLDRGTTGLLLFTNDEQVVAHVTSPQSHLTKRYVAQVSGKLDDDKLEPLRRGMELHDGPARPAKAVIRAPGVVELTLTEGRNHQVKRMLGDVGLPVLKLHREAVGAIECDFPEGTLRELTAEEIQKGLKYRRPH